MGVNKNHILVPIDFSDQSLIALKQSYNLARLTKADLTLINVIEKSFHLPFFSAKEDKSIEKKIQKALEKLADETAKESGIIVNILIVTGKVYEEVQKAAKKLKCSFVIMGTNGSHGLKKFIGSNTLRVIREAPGPVISIKGKKHRTGCKTIVLPLDLTKETKEKVAKAIEIANLFGSTINLVSAITSDDEFIINKLKRQMNQVHEFVLQHNVPCQIEFLHGGDISEDTVEYAKKIKADLIMIMTQEETWTDIMFINSAAQKIINESEVPVLSIRPKVKKDNTVSVFQY